tara:strand:- start:4650 stop:5291 length:642 start_codon:yes stop_codon:yes gene_type:complete
MNSQPKLVVIIDDHPIILKGLKDVLLETEWNATVKTFDNYNDMSAFLENNNPDLFLIDLQLKGKDGRDIISEWRDHFPKAKMIIISSFEDPSVILSVFNRGANGYLIKNLSFPEMVEGIKTIWRGEKYFQEEVKAALSQKNSSQACYSLPRLTSREKEILQLIVQEKTTKEIAETLFLSEKTIESHRSNLYLKLGVKNVVGLVKRAIELDLLK